MRPLYKQSETVITVHSAPLDFITPFCFALILHKLCIAVKFVHLLEDTGQKLSCSHINDLK